MALDTNRGVEVAWNRVDFRRLPPIERDRLRLETEILRHINHEHIINFYDVWENPELEQVVFTTERVTSGSLKSYVKRLYPVKIKVIKKWCRQILLALGYLHNQPYPIIHRDLKCDNIFINGNAGDIRIGDLGLSTMRSQTHAVSVLGTPEFMAPELYDEYYNEKVDIYAFGMCVLEIVSNEYPYEECSNAAQIYKRVSSGVTPESINRISHRPTREFIRECLCPVENRCSAIELLNHPYLNFRSSDYRDSRDANYQSLKPKALPPMPSLTETIPITVTSQEVLLESIEGNIARIVLRIHLGSKRKEIKFPFDLEHDTAEAVAAEMVKELNLSALARVSLADGIFKSIRNCNATFKEEMRSTNIEVPSDQPKSSGSPKQVEFKEQPTVMGLASGRVSEPLDQPLSAVSPVHSDSRIETRESSDTQIEEPLVLSDSGTPSVVSEPPPRPAKNEILGPLAPLDIPNLLWSEVCLISDTQLKKRLVDLGLAEDILNRKDAALRYIEARMGNLIPDDSKSQQSDDKDKITHSTSAPDLKKLAALKVAHPNVEAKPDLLQLITSDHSAMLTSDQLEIIEKLEKQRSKKLLIVTLIISYPS